MCGNLNRLGSALQGQRLLESALSCPVPVCILAARNEAAAKRLALCTFQFIDPSGGY